MQHKNSTIHVEFYWKNAERNLVFFVLHPGASTPHCLPCRQVQSNLQQAENVRLQQQAKHNPSTLSGVFMCKENHQWFGILNAHQMEENSLGLLNHMVWHENTEMTNNANTCEDILTFLRNELRCIPESQVTSLKGEKTSVHQQSLGEIVAEETFADFAWHSSERMVYDTR